MEEQGGNKKFIVRGWDVDNLYYQFIMSLCNNYIYYHNPANGNPQLLLYYVLSLAAHFIVIGPVCRFVCLSVCVFVGL